MSKVIRVSFSEVTPESAEYGDHSRTGWIDEDGYECDDVSEAIRFLRREGVYSASASHFHPGVWYSTPYQITDYSTCTEQERSYHLDGFTPDEERAVWDGLNVQHGTCR